MSVVAVVVAPLGVLLGIVVGAFLEPVKLRFVAAARRRDLRVERCAEVVKAARDIIDALTEFRAVFNLVRRGAITPQPGQSDRGKQLMDDARKAAATLRGATALLELDGPDVLAAAAWTLRDAAAPLVLDVDPSQGENVYFEALRAFEAKLDAFITTARKRLG